MAYQRSFEEIIIDKCKENIINKTIIIDTSDNDYIPSKKTKSISTQLTILVSKADDEPYLYYIMKCNQNPRDSLMLHPFRHIEKDEIKLLKTGDYEIAGIVADNLMIRKMFEYAAMSDEELAKHSGNKHQSCYRASIIQAIDGLWD